MESIDLREKDVAALRSIFGRFPGVQYVSVFGSRTTGRARRASDIDLAIFAPSLTAADWGRLTDAIHEAPVIYEMDIVRLEDLQNGPLRRKIEETGIRIYP